MWKNIKIRNTSGWVTVEALVSGIWAAHKAIGEPEDPDPGFDWTVTHVPTGMRLELGTITANQATSVAGVLGRNVRLLRIDKLIGDQWLIMSLAAVAIESAPRQEVS